MNQRRRQRRGSLMIAIVFLLFAALLALAFHTLLPMEMWSTLQSRQRHTGSLAAEAGISEAVVYLQAGNTPTSATPDVDTPTLISQANDLAGGWSYRIWIEDPAATGVPGTWRATADALQGGKTYLRAVAYLGGPNSGSRDFFDQIRVGGDLNLLAGPQVEYFDNVHTNGSLTIDLTGFGWSNPQNFHQPATWADSAYSQPDVQNAPGGPTKWAKLTDMLVDPDNDANDDASALSAGFSTVAPRPVPNMDPSDPDNVISGLGNSESILSLTMAGNPVPGAGVTLFQDGGVYIGGDDVARISLSVVTDPNDLSTVVNAVHDNDPSTDQWGGQDPNTFHQKMVIEMNSGDVYTVLYDRAADQTKVWAPGVSTTDPPSQTVSGQTNGMVFAEKKVEGIEGANLGQKTFAAEEIKMQFSDQLSVLFRADVEPAVEDWTTQDPYSHNTLRPYVGTHPPGYRGDGITMATTGPFTYQIESGGSPPQFSGKRMYFTYANVMAHGDINYQNDASSLFYFNLVGSVVTENNLNLNRDSPNKGFLFRQDPTNLSYKESSGSNHMPIINYQERYFRRGK